MSDIYLVIFKALLREVKWVDSKSASRSDAMTERVSSVGIDPPYAALLSIDVYGSISGLRLDSVTRCRWEISILEIMVSSTGTFMEFHDSQSVPFLCLVCVLH